MTLYLLAMTGMYCGGLATAISSPASKGRRLRIVVCAALLLWPLGLLLTRRA